MKFTVGQGTTERRRENDDVVLCEKGLTLGLTASPEQHPTYHSLLVKIGGLDAVQNVHFHLFLKACSTKQQF